MNAVDEDGYSEIWLAIRNTSRRIVKPLRHFAYGNAVDENGDPVILRYREGSIKRNAHGNVVDENGDPVTLISTLGVEEKRDLDPK